MGSRVETKPGGFKLWVSTEFNLYSPSPTAVTPPPMSITSPRV
jgi:hypothetical protein